jgi:hypothetical protein
LEVAQTTRGLRALATPRPFAGLFKALYRFDR